MDSANIIFNNKEIVFMDFSAIEDSDVFNRLKELAILGKPVVLKSAIIGISGAKKTLLHIVNRITAMPSKVLLKNKKH